METSIYKNPYNGFILVTEGAAALLACILCMVLSHEASPKMRAFSISLGVTLGAMGLVWMMGGICELLLRHRIKTHGKQYSAAVTGRRKANIYYRSLLGWQYRLTYEHEGQVLSFWTKPMWRHHRCLSTPEVTLYVWRGMSVAEGFHDAEDEAHGVFIEEYVAREP